MSLARAVYSRAGTLILDDVISAVDTHTAQHIIKHLLQSPLVQGRTVIIASHAVEALAPISDKAVYLEDNTVAFQGTGPELLESSYMAHLTTLATSTLLNVQSGRDKDVDRGAGKLQGLPDESALESGMECLDLSVEPLKTPRQLVLADQRAAGQIDSRHWKMIFTLHGGSVYWSVAALIMLGVVLIVPARTKILE